jgi:multifunctional methyltransferase subunit TRM112
MSRILPSSPAARDRTEKGYPLRIEATEVVFEESQVNREMVRSLLPKLDYDALVQASRQMVVHLSENQKKQYEQQQPEKMSEETMEGCGRGSSDEDDRAATAHATSQVTIPTPLPDHLTANLDDLDESTVISLYRFLFDIHLLEGHLVCPDTGRKFPVSQGIPNMVLHEDEL